MHMLIYVPYQPPFHTEHVAQGNKVYVHCKAGRGRSTTLLLCYLIKEHNMTVEDAWAMVLEKRPQVCLATGQWAAVRAFAEACRGKEGGGFVEGGIATG